MGFDAFDAPLLEVARISVAKEDSRWRTREYNDAISECETALAALRALFPNADISADGVSRYAPLPSLVQSRIRTARARIHIGRKTTQTERELPVGHDRFVYRSGVRVDPKQARNGLA